MDHMNSYRYAGNHNQMNMVLADRMITKIRL